MRRIGLAGLFLAMVAAGCGGPMTETEYVEGLNALIEWAGPGFEASDAAYERIAEPSAADLQARVERELDIMYEVRERFAALDPPGSIADVDEIMVDTLADLILASEALVDAAGTVGSLQEAEQTTEFATYQRVDAESDSKCPEVQAKFDALSNRAVIDDPWIADLRLTVTVFLECE